MHFRATYSIWNHYKATVGLIFLKYFSSWYYLAGEKLKSRWTNQKHRFQIRPGFTYRRLGFFAKKSNFSEEVSNCTGKKSCSSCFFLKSSVLSVFASLLKIISSSWFARSSLHPFPLLYHSSTTTFVPPKSQCLMLNILSMLSFSSCSYPAHLFYSIESSKTYEHFNNSRRVGRQVFSMF